MKATVECQFTGFERAKRILDSVQENVSSPKYMWWVARELKTILSRRIDTHGTYAVAMALIPNAPATVSKKGFNQPYFETGRLQSQLTAEKVGERDYFVGVKGDRARITAILEYGAVIPKGNKTVVIPPRRLFRDIMDNAKIKAALLKGLEVRLTQGIRGAS
jgi:hypothetical protein